MEQRLSELKVGETGVVVKISTSGSMRRRLMDMGLVEHTLLRCVGTSPSGDPVAYNIRGAVVAIRLEDSKEIVVERRNQWD